MTTAKKVPPPVLPDVPEDDEVSYIVFREPTTEVVEVNGVPTTVQNYKEHRVSLADWPEYERNGYKYNKGD